MGNPATKRQEPLPSGVGGKVLRAAAVASRKVYHAGKAGSLRSGPGGLQPSVELIPSLCPFCLRTLHGPTALRTIAQHTVLQSRQDGTSQPTRILCPALQTCDLPACTDSHLASRRSGPHPVPAGGSQLGSTNRERGAEPGRPSDGRG